MALSVKDKEELVGVIKLTVNGKIDKLNEKLDKHIENMEPVIDGLHWIESTRKFVLWVGAPIGAVLAFFASFK